MGGLDITDITIGYSSKGAASYIDALNTKAITETESIITTTEQDIISVLREGWQGKACDAYVDKLRESNQMLKDNLKEMQKVFEAMLSAQEQTYSEQDDNMAEVIASASIFSSANN